MNRAYFSVGLTGGVGSGKSTIAGMLLRHGAAVIDADAIAHELTRPGGAAIDALRAAFGAESITAEGALDRAWMRARAFADPGTRRALEQLLHPLIRATAVHRHRDGALVTGARAADAARVRRAFLASFRYRLRAEELALRLMGDVLGHRGDLRLLGAFDHDAELGFGRRRGWR